MDLMKNLSPRKLKEIQRTLAALEFYGLTEEDVRNLSSLIKENKELHEKVKSCKEEIVGLKKTLQALNDPDNKIKKQVADIAKDCFTLPEDD